MKVIPRAGTANGLKWLAYTTILQPGEAMVALRKRLLQAR